MMSDWIDKSVIDKRIEGMVANLIQLSMCKGFVLKLSSMVFFMLILFPSNEAYSYLTRTEVKDLTSEITTGYLISDFAGRLHVILLTPGRWICYLAVNKAEAKD